MAKNIYRVHVKCLILAKSTLNYQLQITQKYEVYPARGTVLEIKLQLGVYNANRFTLKNIVDVWMICLSDSTLQLLLHLKST